MERLIALLKAQGIATDALELELTEYALLTNLCIMNTRIDLLKKAGISVAIDDFGTGYSSLSYLQNLPLSRLKIDASFVQKIGSGRSADAIVRAIVEMAHSLELKVVAEGVETAQQRAFLNQLGCDSFQGYLFSQPLSETEFATLLHARSMSYCVLRQEVENNTQHLLTYCIDFNKEFMSGSHDLFQYYLGAKGCDLRLVIDDSVLLSL